MFRMGRLDLIAHGFEFFFLRLVYRVIQVLADDRNICGDFHDIHPVNLPELLLFRKRRTCHSGLLFELIEQVLERDCRQCLALSLDLHMLLRLYRLMEAVRIPPSRHDAPCKLIDNQDFFVLHNVILILEHQVMRPERKDDIVLNLEVIGIRKVFQVKEILNFPDPVLCEVDVLFFLVDDEVSGLLDILSHNGIHLGKFPAGLAPLKLTRQNVACLIKLCGFPALSGYDERCSRLVDKH